MVDWNSNEQVDQLSKEELAKKVMTSKRGALGMRPRED